MSFPKKADMGIGTLIIFIAMILVAAIAASVLIQTATSLQNKALLTGDRAQQAVSTGLEALLVYGTDGSDGTIEEMRMKVKVIAGSGDIRFNETLVEVDVKNGSLELEYGGATCTDGATNQTHYFVQNLIASSDYREGYLQSGEVSMICFEAPHSMGRDEDIGFSVIPSYGFPLRIDTALPDYIHTTRVFIFP